MEKDESNVRLVAINNYIYADHTYKQLPIAKDMNRIKGQDWPAIG